MSWFIQSLVIQSYINVALECWWLSEQGCSSWTKVLVHNVCVVSAVLVVIGRWRSRTYVESWDSLRAGHRCTWRWSVAKAGWSMYQFIQYLFNEGYVNTALCWLSVRNISRLEQWFVVVKTRLFIMFALIKTVCMLWSYNQQMTGSAVTASAVIQEWLWAGTLSVVGKNMVDGENHFSCGLECDQQ